MKKSCREESSPVPGDHRSVLVGRVLAENLGILPGSALHHDIPGLRQAPSPPSALRQPGIDQNGEPAHGLHPHTDAPCRRPGNLRHGRFTFTPWWCASPRGLIRHAPPGSFRNPPGDDALELTTWERLIPEIAQFVVLDNIAGYIFSFILYIVVAFAVLNTIQMAVFERTREFGVLLSIGTTLSGGFFP